MKPPDSSLEKVSRCSSVVSIRAGEEYIIPEHANPSGTLAPGITIREFASNQCGARGMNTSTATFEPGVELSYHKHDVSEAATVLKGKAVISVEGRIYKMGPFDCIHFPAGVAHRVTNPSRKSTTIIHTAFGSPTPLREFVSDDFIAQDRPKDLSDSKYPEHFAEIATGTPYRLAAHTRFYDLFGGRFGAVGICGGYGEFNPGSSLPCHFHKYDESITIVKGEAICEVMGRRYRLGRYGTAVVPQGLPHRFLNMSREIMAIIWVYAGSEPTRTIANARYCLGQWKWKGQV